MSTFVKVEGDDKEKVRLVAAGVLVGLENTGFTDVKLAVEHEIRSVDDMLNVDRSLDAPSTLLTSVRMRAPDLFNDPVVVQVPLVKPDGKGVRAMMTSDDLGRLNMLLQEQGFETQEASPEEDGLDVSVRVNGKTHKLAAEQVHQVLKTERAYTTLLAMAGQAQEEPTRAWFAGGKCYDVSSRFVDALEIALEPRLAKD